ncbi:hypothetical protein C8F04DRAFT_1202300 [Mycena alexandri]|uniref:Uncharacterized protein n=1 Tax=Mycena alexandri TaxID=1745969 RepID=A0AAD6RY25_9AGAR|nr:hypothetical protein C8F04DRAFT_1202300 [Mycena alexandri]
MSVLRRSTPDGARARSVVFLAEVVGDEVVSEKIGVKWKPKMRGFARKRTHSRAQARKTPGSPSSSAAPGSIVSVNVHIEQTKNAKGKKRTCTRDVQKGVAGAERAQFPKRKTQPRLGTKTPLRIEVGTESHYECCADRSSKTFARRAGAVAVMVRDVLCGTMNTHLLHTDTALNFHPTHLSRDSPERERVWYLASRRVFVVGVRCVSRIQRGEFGGDVTSTSTPPVGALMRSGYLGQADIPSSTRCKDFLLSAAEVPGVGVRFTFIPHREKRGRVRKKETQLPTPPGVARAKGRSQPIHTSRNTHEWPHSLRRGSVYIPRPPTADDDGRDELDVEQTSRSSKDREEATGDEGAAWGVGRVGRAVGVVLVACDGSMRFP